MAESGNDSGGVTKRLNVLRRNLGALMVGVGFLPQIAKEDEIVREDDDLPCPCLFD